LQSKFNYARLWSRIEFATQILYAPHNNKYPIDILLSHVIFILENGIAFRKLSTITKIHWSTIYNFHIKLIKYNIFEDNYNKLVNRYLTKLPERPENYYVDSTFICNKLGSESISFNSQVKKHKTCKISILTDSFNIPLSLNISTGSVHDSIMLKNQLIDLHKNQNHIFTNNNTLIADTAYDSSFLRNQVKDLKFGILLAPVNKRNSHDTTPINQYSLYDFLLLRSRIDIEHTMNTFKQFKRIQLRYDRLISTYSSFVYLAASIIILKKTGKHLI